MQHYTLLERNLIYTAVTRGEKLVTIIGQPKALAMAVKNKNATIYGERRMIRDL
jgi:exodeoxyribonuclease V alpha subunit